MWTILNQTNPAKTRQITRKSGLGMGTQVVAKTSPVVFFFCLVFCQFFCLENVDHLKPNKFGKKKQHPEVRPRNVHAEHVCKI